MDDELERLRRFAGDFQALVSGTLSLALKHLQNTEQALLAARAELNQVKAEAEQIAVSALKKAQAIVAEAEANFNETRTRAEALAEEIIAKARA